ncbi:MAG: DUF2076 domain-containing protein [Buchnera aphidicola (Brevicoryne brassicae)]|uniref:DUF2076 domain-containing protein n=1 Tax=Buchnera aphidicola (Brevicoryne brassicae) TaxID=911343 RepID=A0AAJ5TXG9_9GAMM|nr:DUF2076 domain-containing protein [Buchnera aphidicola]QCI19758.1 DUF2076 domain-containing protein [Buchnera aphidicola (Brevicoryne brassicae)]WAI19128.1 MAG: DUF2076 domain-containing protein [Buchnera aphidicola (Brevicoryne brassicae)]
MKDEEKNLIENLFHRLKNTELNSFERDNSADELIQKLVKKQPSSSYYMAQTILIQETAIKKMSVKIEELKKRIKSLKEESNTKPSFLSNFFKKNATSQTLSHDNNLWKNNDNHLQSHYSNPMMSSPSAQSIPTVSGSRNNSFLSNALQTATGVAGGMILGNMLMNVFNHSKPEEEVFDAINNNNNMTSLQHHEDENKLDANHNNLVNYEKNENELDEHASNLDVLHDNSEIDYESIDHEDDNFL